MNTSTRTTKPRRKDGVLGAPPEQSQECPEGRGLGRMGHRIRQMTGPFGGYQAIGYDAENGVYIGASESRKDGQAAGY